VVQVVPGCDKSVLRWQIQNVPGLGQDMALLRWQMWSNDGEWHTCAAVEERMSSLVATLVGTQLVDQRETVLSMMLMVHSCQSCPTQPAKTTPTVVNWHHQIIFMQ